MPNQNAAVAQQANSDAEISKEHLAAMVDLLSAMSQADGKVLQIENVTAEALLECYKPNQVEQVRALYHSAVKIHPIETPDSVTNDFIANLNVDQQLDLLRSLWMIAKSDGVIHPKEQKLIFELLMAMGGKQVSSK